MYFPMISFSSVSNGVIGDGVAPVTGVSPSKSVHDTPNGRGLPCTPPTYFVLHLFSSGGEPTAL